jgi:hypothetical protein
MLVILQCDVHTLNQQAKITLRDLYNKMYDIIV